MSSGRSLPPARLAVDIDRIGSPRAQQFSCPPRTMRVERAWQAEFGFRLLDGLSRSRMLRRFGGRLGQEQEAVRSLPVGRSVGREVCWNPGLRLSSIRSWPC